MSFIRTMIRRLADTPPAQRLRNEWGFKPPLAVRPPSPEYAVSDLFPWRVDDTWDTRFDLTNVPSMIFPDRPPVDRPVVVVFDIQGREIARRKFELQPFEVQPLLLRDLVGASGPAGTFAVFHDPGAALAELREAGCNIAERGYLCFKRKGDSLWGVVHGNLHALCKHPAKDEIDFVAGRRAEPAPYRIQVRFDDTDRFELTFANPTPKPQKMVLRLLDEGRAEIGRQEQVIQPRGLGLFAVDNADRRVITVESAGGIAMWRPAIFKYYATHYNVLHS